MGRASNWHPPRHLAVIRRSRTDAREHQVAEWLLAAVAIVLTLVILVGQMLGRPSPPDPEAAPPATASGAQSPGATRNGATAPPATTAPPAAAPPSGGWLALGGARVEAAEPAGAGRRPGRFTASGPGDQGIALPGLLRCVPGRIYAATLLVRASRPGTLLQVSLLEVAGGRRVAFDTIGAVLTDARWLRVEVAHEAHRPGTALAVEVVLPRGSPRATVQVGDLEVGPQQGHSLAGG
jgi:hypothetical protein